MDNTYTQLSEFALSWALAGMAGFFALVVLWAFRPGNRKIHDEVARSIFRNDSQPAAGQPTRDPSAPAPRSAVKGA